VRLSVNARTWLTDKVNQRVRDKNFKYRVIGGKDNPYLLRWKLHERWYGGVFLHLFMRDDDPRALHDHPWLFNVSVLLSGCYVEVTKRGRETLESGAIKLRLGPSPHRIELVKDKDGKPHCVTTLFFFGPKTRNWGFLCPNGWRRWQDFTGPANSDAASKGCD
jgi:hypothetical protein